jgi:hypothetical protein
MRYGSLPKIRSLYALAAGRLQMPGKTSAIPALIMKWWPVAFRLNEIFLKKAVHIKPRIFCRYLRFLSFSAV